MTAKEGYEDLAQLQKALGDFRSALVLYGAQADALAEKVEALNTRMANGRDFATKCDRHTHEIAAANERLDRVDTLLERMGARVWQVFVVLITLLLSQIAAWAWRFATSQQLDKAVGYVPYFCQFVRNLFS